MNSTFPVRVTLKFNIDDAANSHKAQFDALSNDLKARSFIRGTSHRIIEQYPLVIEAHITKKHASELGKRNYVESVSPRPPAAQPLKARESFYRARISDYVSP